MAHPDVAADAARRRNNQAATGENITKPILLILFVLILLITIADIGAEAQLVYPRYPIWVLVVSAQLCLVVFVYRFQKQ